MRPRQIALLCACICFAIAYIALQMISPNYEAPLGGLFPRAFAVLPAGGAV